MLISKYTSDKRTLLGTKGHHSDEGELSKAHCNPSVRAPNQGASEHAEGTALWEQQTTPPLEAETSAASQ